MHYMKKRHSELQVFFNNVTSYLDENHKGENPHLSDLKDSDIHHDDLSTNALQNIENKKKTKTLIRSWQHKQAKLLLLASTKAA